MRLLQAPVVLGLCRGCFADGGKHQLEENDLNIVCASFGVKVDIYFCQGRRWVQEGLSIKLKGEGGVRINV